MFALWSRLGSKQSDIPTRKQITNPKDVSNSFNDHYSNINENILKEIKYERHQEGYGDLMTYMPPHKFYCHTFSYWRWYILHYQQIQWRKGIDPSSIPTKILKLISLEICEPLSWIANICFSTSIHPKDWNYQTLFQYTKTDQNY